MKFEQLLQENKLVLTECAISERLRRRSDVELHPVLFNTPLIYDQLGRERLSEIYLSYRQVAKTAKLPILLCAPTWRVDRERIAESGVADTINRDAVSFMQAFRAQYISEESTIIAGALIAPKNDCYTPALSLNREEAATYHGWQIGELVDAGAEVIIAQTMPAVSESLGLADCLAASGASYIISFVVDRMGEVLDGTPLSEAIDCVDQSVSVPPVGYMVNCVYPTFINIAKQPESLVRRLVGIQANASSKDHEDLDGAEQLQQDPLQDWGENMLELHRKYGVQILGGCCGTDDRYLQYLVDNLRAGDA